ncbi:PEP-CTERM/exosortase system-associated acyltransferase [Salinicola endophyticus]|uniref:PEP-CTERM/exosortase system-associated acyltransferase n=1 Tax=Salinicola endophyticus TaxID=1949083 RepID=A0ABY8FKN5_9GAMM|nr:MULTISPECIES: PEP-CTERM/exosortase system-associated acyltransferase [Salinicola]WFF41736.1 PEP-CTERM/exosortase system-associated acyltransferase [Salinicola endophyticus]
MNLYDQFNDQFEFVLAINEQERHQVYRLRYQVYTHEFGHEMPGDPQRGLEYDAFDQSALHCFVRRRDTGEAVACIRVIYPGSDQGELASMPIESNAAGYFVNPLLTPCNLPRRLICEVSRAAILGRYRKKRATDRKWEGAESDFPSSEQDYRVASLLGVSVYLASTVMIGLLERQHAFALMEPRLARLLRRFGLNFLQIGAEQQFNGVRAAYYVDQHRARENLKEDLARFYRGIARSLASQFRQDIRPKPKAMAFGQR